MNYDTLASKEIIDTTIKAFGERNIHAEFVNGKEDALKRIKEIIPAGASVMTGSSVTLEQIGFVDLLKSGNHSWQNLKNEITAEKDSAKQGELRKKSVLSQYFLGSVHAVASTGEVVVASASGSQLPSYAFTSDNVIWVVGAQKITPTLESAIKRVREYVLPLESKRIQGLGAPGSVIGKLLIFEKEIMPNRKITLIFVNEKLGF